MPRENPYRIAARMPIPAAPPAAAETEKAAQKGAAVDVFVLAFHLFYGRNRRFQSAETAFRARKSGRKSEKRAKIVAKAYDDAYTCERR